VTRLAWDQPGERLFETGVDRGVFFPNDGGAGVPWGGLVSVSESSDGGNADPYYLDGVKFLEMPTSEDFALSISAIGSPKEFANCNGFASTGNGLFIGQQPRRSFGFAYRTKVGNDTLGIDLRYKLHMVYNILAAPADKEYATLSDSTEAMINNWACSTTPKYIAGYKPSSHLVIDSGDVTSEMLSAIEDILYGSDTTTPRLPTPQEIILYLGGPYTRWLGTVNGSQSQRIIGERVLTNLATNPALETSSGTIEIRRNYAPTPMPDSTWGGSFGTGGAGTHTVIADARFRTGFARKMLFTTASSGTAYMSAAGGITFASGETWTFSIRVVPNAVLPANPIAFDPGNWTDVASGSVDHGDGTKTYWRTVTATGVFNRGVVLGYTLACPINTAIIAGDAMIEKSPAFNPFFSGAYDIRDRVNTFPNPAPRGVSTAMLNGWAGAAPGVSTTSIISGVTPSGANSFFRTTWTVAPASGVGACYIVRSTSGSLPAGVSVPISFAVRSSRDETVSFNAIRYAAGVNSGNQSNAGIASIALIANQWARVSGIVPLSGTEDGYNLYVYTTLPQVGTSVDIAEIVETDTGGYFDGESGAGYRWKGAANSSISEAFDIDLIPAWLGVVNASASVLNASGVIDVLGGSAKAFQSSIWSLSGKSLRIKSTYATSGTAYAEVASSSTPRGMVAGKTYTILATCYMKNAHVGVSTSSRRICFTYNVGGYLAALSPQATNAAKTSTELRLTFTIPLNVTDWYLRLFNGEKSGDSDVWWDNLLIVEGTYDGPYFDGGTLTPYPV